MWGGDGPRVSPPSGALWDPFTLLSETIPDKTPCTRASYLEKSLFYSTCPFANGLTWLRLEQENPPKARPYCEVLLKHLQCLQGMITLSVPSPYPAGTSVGCD